MNTQRLRAKKVYNCLPQTLNKCKANYYQHILKKFLKIVILSLFPCYVRLIEERHERLKINKFRALFISPLDFEIDVFLFQTYLQNCEGYTNSAKAEPGVITQLCAELWS